MKRLVSGIHHVALKCEGREEFDRTVAFYTDILGMELVKSWGDGAGSVAHIDSSCGVIEVFANAESRLPQGAVRHFAFKTEDVDACAAAVRAAGYEVTVEPKDLDVRLHNSTEYPIRIAFCIGPVGEEIEFFCERQG